MVSRVTDDDDASMASPAAKSSSLHNWCSKCAMG